MTDMMGNMSSMTGEMGDMSTMMSTMGNMTGNMTGMMGNMTGMMSNMSHMMHRVGNMENASAHMDFMNIMGNMTNLTMAMGNMTLPAGMPDSFHESVEMWIDNMDDAGLYLEDVDWETFDISSFATPEELEAYVALSDEEQAQVDELIHHALEVSMWEEEMNEMMMWMDGMDMEGMEEMAAAMMLNLTDEEWLESMEMTEEDWERLEGMSSTDFMEMITDEMSEEELEAFQSMSGQEQEELLMEMGNMLDAMAEMMMENEGNGLESCTQAAGLGLCVHPTAESYCRTTCNKGGCDTRTVQTRADWYVSAGCCGSGAAVQSVCPTADSFVAPLPPKSADGTELALPAGVQATGDVELLQVEQHTITGSLTLDVSEVGDLGNEASRDAMKDAIAAQLGLSSADDVEDVVITIKVKGSMPMTVSNPAAFAASSEARLGIETAIANQNEVAVQDVTATITVVSRRLRDVARRLQGGGVDVSYEIEVQDGATADAMTTSFAAADTAALATAVNAELATAGGDLTVTSVESITAEPEVLVSYSIVTEDAAVAESVQTAVEEADATAFTASINEELEAAGVETTVTVSEISAPEVATATVTVTQNPALLQDAGQASDSSTAMLSAGVVLLLIASAGK
jgi:hypothetical protein